MAEYKVIAKVVGVRGHCEAKHEVGQEFEFSLTSPAGLCCHALGSMWPTVNLLMYGGQYPWDAEPGVTTWACPDTDNLVTFKLRRVEVPADR